MHVKSVEAQTSSRWCGMEVRRGSASSGVVPVTCLWLKIMRSVARSPGSREEDDTSVGLLSPNYHTTSTGGH
ncbi:hypothetical protein TNCV_1206351 [Trichonephila clavipes]|nr:hypothetical protein TNCV_1206351 [Trichonephila clavipes]